MIDLTALKLTEPFDVSLVEFGGVLTPALGGPRQRISRIGTRFAFGVNTPNMDMAEEGQRWSVRLARAKLEGGLIAIPEGDRAISNVGNPVVATAAAGGSIIQIKDARPGLILPEGKWLSMIHDGRRFAHQITEDVLVAENGTVQLPVFPMLRAVLTVGDVAEIAVPKAQGTIEGEFGWSPSLAGYTSFSFMLAEDE